LDAISEQNAVERFTTIWKHVECGIIIVDAQTREIIAVNPVAALMFGDDPSKIIGKRCHKFICPAEQNSCPIMDKGQVLDRSERLFVRADGTTIPIIKSVAKIQYDGRPALLESFTDISNLKEAEERIVNLKVMEQAYIAKNSFLSRMSHEMRTPMNTIIGMTKISESETDLKKLKYCLSMIGMAADHLLKLINDVLDMAKIEAGKFELDAGPILIEETLIKICNFFTEQIDEKNITFNVYIRPDMAMHYIGDELRLSQVLTNLMSNAIKFTPNRGKITLTADEIKRRENSSVVRFSVSDTGIGMSPEHISKVFNAFEQANASISSRFGGSGLGLAISKGIVEKMNGVISVDSTPGKGTTFTVDVELQHPAEPIIDNIFDDIQANKRILILDGDQNCRNLFVLTAKKMQIRVDSTADRNTALLRIAHALHAGDLYDAIFVDYNNALFLASDLPSDADFSTLVLMATPRQCNSLEAKKHSSFKHFLTKPLFPSTIAASIMEATGVAIADKRADDAPEEGVADFSDVSLLLVDDVEMNREVFATLLEPTGVKIDIAVNGLEALEKFRDAPYKFDAIIMDVEMPVMGGHEATRAIRALDVEKARSIPIIAMTANVFKSDIEKCLECGMNGHLSKPIDIKLVIETIRSLVVD